MKNNYPWKATFKNGSMLSQYENEKEMLYKEVLERKNSLVSFTIISPTGEEFEVDLIHGTLSKNGKVADEICLKEDEKADLIYERINKVTMSNYKISSREITHRIGLKSEVDKKVMEVKEHAN